MNNKIIAILGFSASGKDSIARILEREYNYKFIVSTTSRPRRSNEVEGREYYFKTENEFKELIKNDKLIEYRSYNTIEQEKNVIWHYGIQKSEIDLSKHNHIVSVDYKGYQDLKNAYGDKVISIFIDVDEESRRMRAIARDRNFELSEWERRYKDDISIFANIKDKVDFIAQNYNLKECVDEVISFLQEGVRSDLDRIS